jgi:hypothetical protein
MTVKSRGAMAWAVAVVLAAGVVSAQSTEKYSARLAWVPISGADRANVTGKGMATATLSGSKLAVNGTFEGLAASATIARVHDGVAKGARGPAIGDLVISKGTSGTISGGIALTKEQLESLKQGRLYIQVHSEKGVAPDGSTLWGWFLR